MPYKITLQEITKRREYWQLLSPRARLRQKMKRLETSFKLSKDKLSFKFMKMRKHPQLCGEVIYRIFI